MSQIKLTVATLLLTLMVVAGIRVAAGPHTQRPPPCPPCVDWAKVVVQHQPYPAGGITL